MKLNDNYYLEGFDTKKEARLIHKNISSSMSVIYIGKTSEIPEEIALRISTKVEFRPDEGFPLCIGYMIGEDDGNSILYTTAFKAVQKACDKEFCIIYKK